MKRPGTARRNTGGVKWDEPNLADNERIKAELNAVKITEPKTPYHGPLSESQLDGEDDLQHLNLDDHGHDDVHGNGNAAPVAEEAGPSTADCASGHPSNGAADMEVDHSTHANHTHSESSHRPSDSAGGWTSSGYSSDNEAPHAGGSSDGDSASSGRVKKHFEAARRAHYNMRDALLKAKEALQQEGEEEGEDAQQNGEAQAGSGEYDPGRGSGSAQ